MVLLDFDSPAAHQPQRRGGRRETNKQADGKRLDNCIEGPSEESLIGHGRRPGVSRLGNAVHLATETFPYAPEGVKEFKTGRDREGEAPAEPPGARTCWGDGSPGGSPSQSFHTFPSKRESPFFIRGDVASQTAWLNR